MVNASRCDLLMALLVFDKAGNVKQDNKDEILAAKKMALARPVICLHQDCYFVHDKGLCPFGVFYSHENDYTFIMKTRQGDNFGKYFWESDDTRPLGDHYDGVSNVFVALHIF
jgi:hypothetical protein